MDLRTGRTYDTKEDALADGVPESDVFQVPVVVSGSGPFKGRVYERTASGLRRIRNQKQADDLERRMALAT